MSMTTGHARLVLLPSHGVYLATDTHFVAGLHDTTTDTITLYEDSPAPGHQADMAAAQDWLAPAALGARAERALRLPGATAATVAAHARDWAEVRPERGLAGCAAFIAAPRAIAVLADLQGRAFLHSYGWQTDEGFGTLERILTAPVVVASWSSLQYYGSTVAPSGLWRRQQAHSQRGRRDRRRAGQRRGPAPRPALADGP
jgi:uncharacterized protein YbcC (UPF0753/DUF2309 family)